MSSSIVVDGNLSDWTAAQRIDNPSNIVAGYALYGTVQSNTYLIAIQATAAADPVIGPGTTIWLNTDQNAATGYSPFDSIGADYNVTFNALGIPYLYTGAAGQTLVSATPLTYSLSPDGKSLEIAIPRSLVTPVNGPAPTSINILAELNNSAGNSVNAIYLPGDYNSPEYTITDPATLVAAASTHKVAIVYSDTSAARYFSQTAYSDLIMAAQNQARMAGVSYDLIDESKLTSVSNLIGYSAIIFPAMPDVNTAQLPAIMSALTSAVYNYHIGIITAGDFLTNDQTGAPLPGNSYANMEALLGLARASGGNSASVTVTANDVSNPILHGYTAGQTIQSYSSEGYAAYQGVGTTPDVLVNQNVSGVGTPPGVVETTTGGTNVQFATTDLLGDSNLLSNVIQTVVLGSQPGVTLHESRQAGIVAVRMDMDQSQFPEDVSPVSATGAPLPGIYDTLVPILQQWEQKYDFVGSYYINIGDTPTAASPGTTNWAVSAPYYKALLATGGEIGIHSYTHLISPPTVTVAATTTVDTPPGSTQITLATLPSFAGVTVGMIVTGLNIGANTPVTGVAGEGGAVANTVVTAVSGNTITLSYVPGGYGAANSGVLGDIPAGTTLTFGVPAENTNFLQTATGTVPSASGNPFTYDYEFNQSKLLVEQQLGITIYGAAVPGANETYATDQNILPYYSSVAATATTAGYTGYVTGGWTGVGSGYPSAIGYMSPTDTGSVYIAPNMTFDFTEIQYEGKTVAQAEADWAAQFAAIGANAAGTPVAVLPIHDYGVAAWNTTNSTATGSPYTTQMYSDFIANAYAQNYEFLTLEELAARTAAQQKASINYTTVGTTITATVTPDPTAPDLGGMALSVVNGGTQVIQSVKNWYAYNAQELFLPANGGTFAINLGTTQDDVTHIENLPSRADLLSVTGDGTNLNFAMTGDGQVVVDLKNPAASIVSIQGAPTASLTGNALDLTFADVLAGPTYLPLLHTVSVEEGATEFSTALNDIIIGTSGNDILTSPGSGHNTIVGNGGTDTIIYSGSRLQYGVVTNSDGSTTVTDLRAGSPDGTDTLIGVVNILFAAGISSIAASGTGITNGAGDIGVGGTISLTVNFSEAVTVAGGTPTLTLNDGGVATYSGGSGTGALTFTYVVAAGQNTPDLVISSFNLPAGVTVRTAAGANADITPAANYNPTGILQIDTIPPTETAAIVAMTDDSGVAGDFITNIGLAGRTVSGTISSALLAGETLQASFDAGATWTAATVNGTSWSVVDSSSHAANWIIEARVVDLAGNAGPTASRTVTFDATPPTTSLAMAPASDSGLSNTDDITNVTKPIFTGTTTGGSTVTLFDGTSQIGTAVASATGQWSITTTLALANGTHSITARATDVAGNAGILSAALPVIIDTVAPLAPSTPHLIAASDTGKSSTDDITKINTPTFTGTAEAGSTVTLFDGTTVVGTGVATAGTWSITAAKLADGTHSITDNATDVAGNVSAASGKLSVTIDTVAPSAPVLTNLAGNTSLLAISGTGEAGATVSILNGTTTLGTATVNSGGVWKWAFLPGNSSTTRTLTAVATDIAGNTSGSTGTIQIGSSGASTLTSTTGNDLFYGGAGADTFSFLANFGKDFIADFMTAGTAHDTINFHGISSLNTFANVLIHTVQVGSSSVISDGNGDTLTLANVSRAGLSSVDFKFV